jgi:hypothetical protein
MERHTMTTSTREALERGTRRRSRLRTGLVVGGIVALVLGLAAAAGAVVVPPWLATIPADAYTATTRVTVVDTALQQDDPTAPPTASGSTGRASSTASIEVSAGWTPIGVGPFLPDDRAELVSPDGAYRARVELTGPITADDPTPGDSTDHLEAALGAAVWSRESLDSGCTVRYTTVEDGTDAVTVAVIAPPAGATGEPEARLVLVGTVDADDAVAYRTVTADLVTSARFGGPPITIAPTGPADPAVPATPAASGDGGAR